ncbi:protein-disulfide reductase DsbD family protein [Thiocapsa sp. UBA6158]|uniref:protein-disulfide reductase DsbD family protein n=1 Tax=Thiocapsa sp. UBA6158 TaxID=1947692 RepID=UPI0025F4F14A|nr:protein-disulfide reductase DsbD domain-containing protein [Thiocapsa sp. UBA6158]
MRIGMRSEPSSSSDHRRSADRRLFRIGFALFLVSLVWTGSIQANPVTTENVTARLVAERMEVAPGDRLDLALVFEIRPGWHTYWRNPGDSGDPPRVHWTLPEGVEAGPLRWPRPEVIPVGPLANYGYSGRAVHLIALSVPAQWPIGEPVHIRADVDWLVCEEECIPESGRFDLTLPTGAALGPGPIDPLQADVFAAARAGLPDGRIEGAVLGVAGAGLGLLVPADGLSDKIDGAWFFAGEWGLIEHAAEQPWRLVDGQLRIDLSPGALSDQASPEGLLVIADARGEVRSYEVAAVRGPLPDGIARDRPIGLPLAFAFALLGGLILNLMPCVFPILAMKALSLINGLSGQGPEAARERVLHGLAYTAGVLLFFAGLAVLLLALRAGGSAVGWGFQLQYPPFVVFMAYVFFVIGLSLAGAVTIGSRLMSLGGARTGSGTAGAFGTGALAALVAAPCTAPFMGAALGYAVTLSWPLALAIMLTLGFGLALPFLALSLLPRLARLLPKAGAWMETLKQALAFPMFAAAAWLVWVLSVQTGSAGVALVLGGLVLLAFGLWLGERTRGLHSARRRWGLAATSVALVAALYLGVATDRLAVPTLSEGESSASGLASVPYSPERLAAARDERRPVFVNMTAAWCITCLVNERVALSTSELARTFADSGVLYLKGDWTNRDPAITAYLADHGRNGVPLYVFYPPDGDPQVLPQILTEDMVLRALRASAPGSSGRDG